LGKTAILAFLSPHRQTLARCLDAEYAQFPDLSTRRNTYFERVAEPRNHRADEEIARADWIVTNSTFTTRSLEQAGVPIQKILTVPLGGPTPVNPEELPRVRPDVVRFVYVGPVSVRKGAHYLLRAWKQVAQPGVELHLYGTVLLPDQIRRDALLAPGGGSITFHGSIPALELASVYLQSSALVLPTLCDGFGMVVSEALAHGLPVITTQNAGAAALVENGRTGFVVPAADPDALVRALTWCRDHPDELFEMRRAAWASAHRWTWAHFRHRFVDVLNGALDGRHAEALDAVAPALGIAG
jgi:glycosyltransferase involved in cell wall biosynthesis